MFFKLTIALLAVCAVTSGGCATSFTGTSQQLTVSSNPTGARVFVNGSYFGITPVAVLLKTRRDYSIILQHDGFQDSTARVARQFNPVALLNVFSVLCWVVDLSSGAIWRLDRSSLYVTMVPAQYPVYELPQPRNGWSPEHETEPPSVPFESAPPPEAPEPPAPAAPPPRSPAET